MTRAADRRAAAIQSLSNTSFDVVVVGGGITGAGIARDAALRGLRTALLERDDFASGTSSRSSRLIHGGVRYLEHGHVHLVFESSRERRTLLRVARHLVRPLAFTWPVYRGDRIGRGRLFAGLALYDALALFRNVAAHTPLGAVGVRKLEPELRQTDLLGGARYFDASTDDARLTLANAVGAAEAGAVVLNHAAVVGLERVHGRARGVMVEDRLQESRFVVAAQMVVNATGAESHALQRLESDSSDPMTLVSVGAHVAVPRARVGNREAVTMLHPQDQRVLFVLPAGAQAIVSTTESVRSSDGGPPRPTGEDVAYLLAAVNRYFPRAELGERDVIAAWAGIRPLVADLARNEAGAASREHAITMGAAGMLSVTGGKLTTYRAIAEEVVDEIVSAIGMPYRQRCRTASVPLPGADFTSLSELWGAASRDGVPLECRDRLVGAYGSRYREVWQYATNDPALATPIVEGLPYIGAELAYAAEQEMAFTLGDALIRRTHAAFERSDHGLSAAPRAAEILGRFLGWDSAQRRQALEAYASEIKRTFAVAEA